MRLNFIIAAALIVGGTTAHAAGFEKAVLWSGKQAGYAGAGISVVNGSESTFFNPAGLAAGSSSGDFSLNASPTFINSEGSLASSNQVEQTDENYSTLGSASVAYRLNDRFGFGFAFSAAGGSKAIYDSVDLSGDSSNVTFQPKIQTDLKLIEYALGAGYELSPGFRVGIAWRIVTAKGNLATIKKTVTNTAYSYLSVTDAKQTKYNGFRVGAQYDSPDHEWGLGLNYRNGINFVAEGTGTGSTTVIPTNSTTAATGSLTKIALSLPWALSVGGNYLVSDGFRLFLATDYVNYAKNAQIGVTGTLGGSTLPNIPLNWKNMWNFRLGGEWQLSDMEVRAGYALTTRVTSKTDARATLAPPSLGHTFTAGAGTKFMDQKLELNGALEYAMNSGDGSMSATASGSTTKELLAGVSTKSKVHVFGIHAGMTYHF